MSSITSFLSNGRYIYQKWTESPSGTVDTSCSAGGSGIANASNYSWVSGGTANTSAVSGSSGHYEQIGTAENLNVDQLIELFTKGNMIASEAEKMLQAHKNEITNVNAYKSGNMIRYTFRYNNTNYSIACSNDAAASQLDYKEQQLFTKSQLRYSYGINDENINKYFSVAFSDGSNLQFAFNPDYGFKNIYDVFAQIQSDNTKNASGTSGSSGSMNVNNPSGASGSGYVSSYYTNNGTNGASGTVSSDSMNASFSANNSVNGTSNSSASASINTASNTSDTLNTGNTSNTSNTSAINGPNNGGIMTVREVEKRIGQILDEVKDAKITPEQAVRKLRLYGITVMSDIDDGTTVYLFTYNKKDYMFHAPIIEEPDVTDGCRRGNIWDDEEEEDDKAQKTGGTGNKGAVDNSDGKGKSGGTGNVNVDVAENQNNWNEEIQSEVQNLFIDIIYSQNYDRLSELGKYTGVKVTIAGYSGSYNVNIYYPNGESFDLDVSGKGKIEAFLQTDLGKAMQVSAEHPVEEIRTVEEIVALLQDSGSYTLDELKNKYQLTDEDIELFFRQDGDKYVINDSVPLENYFNFDLNEEIKYDITGLFDLIRHKGFKKSFVNEYKFSDEIISKFFIGSGLGNRNYKLNVEECKKIFPDREINTLSQLKQAIEETGYSAPVIQGEYSSVTLSKDIGLSKQEIEMFFIKCADIKQENVKTIFDDFDISIATYNLNTSVLREFFGVKADAIKTPADLKKIISETQLNDKQIKMVLDYTQDACLDASSTWGFDKLDNAMTQEQLFNVYSSFATRLENHFAGTLKELESEIQKSVTYDINQNNLANLRALIESDEFKTEEIDMNTYTSYTAYAEKLREYLTIKYKSLCPDLTDEYLDKVFDYTYQNCPSYYYNQISEYRFELCTTLLYDENGNVKTDEEGVPIQKYSSEEIDQMVEAKKQELAEYNPAYLSGRLKCYDELCNDIMESLPLFYNNSTTKIEYEYYDSGHIKRDENGAIYNQIPESKYGMNSESIYDWIYRYQSGNYSSVKEFQARLFWDKINDIGLSGDEAEALTDVVIRELAKITGSTKTDEMGKILISMDDLMTLETNNGRSVNTVLDKIFQIFSEKADSVNHIDNEIVMSTSSIDSNELFKDGDFLNAEYIESHLSEMLLSGDPGVRKFAQMIDKLCKSVKSYKDIYTKTQKQERIKWFITILNAEAGITNNDDNGHPSVTNVGLTPELLNKLGGNVFDKISEVVNSEKLENCFLANVDGILGDVVQNGGTDGTNDCWLLADAIAINSTTAGKELIKNAIRWNSDYTAVIVTYPSRPDEPVTIPVSKLLEIDADLNKENPAISNTGDNDFLALAIAYEELFNDDVSVAGNGAGFLGTASDVVTRLLNRQMKYADTFFQDFLPNGKNITHDIHAKITEAIFDALGSLGPIADSTLATILGGPVLGGLLGPLAGTIGGVASITSDGKVDMGKKDVLNGLSQILQAKQDGNNVAASFTIMAVESTRFSCETTDGEIWEYSSFVAAHVMAITDITPTTITFTDSESDGSSYSYTVTWEEFLKIGIAELSWAVF